MSPRWPLVYQQIDKAFPDSKFILTKRRTAKCWFDSLCRLARLTEPTEYRKFVYGHEMPQGRERELTAFYHRHNEMVENHFHDRPDKLLVVSWDNGDGWEQLCAFLGHDVPDQPFPHVNRSDRLEQIMREKELTPYLK